MIKKSFILVLVFLFSTKSVYSACNEGKCDSMDEYPAYINELSTKKDNLSKSKNTLSNQIQLLDSQYQLTLTKITQTERSIATLEKEISGLSVEIGKLEKQIDSLSATYINQIIQSYKLQKKYPSFAYLFSDNINTFLEQHQYLSSVQSNSKQSLIDKEKVRYDYDTQKTAKENKQNELEELKKNLASQKSSLASQKAAKNNLLEITKNDEKKYAELLGKAQSEYEAINSILAGKGIEEKVKEVNEGDVIAYVISGSSCSSSGTHLHFMVTNSNSEVQNPLNYLKSTDYINCSGSSCNSSDGDSFNPSGSWNWPLASTIKFNQGYGNTWSVRNTWVRSIYTFHNGIDIAGSSTTVTTPIKGTLYRGSYYIKSSKCSLRYVKVIGTNGYNTLNLHVNYTN